LRDSWEGYSKFVQKLLRKDSLRCVPNGLIWSSWLTTSWKKDVITPQHLWMPNATPSSHVGKMVAESSSPQVPAALALSVPAAPQVP
jgi:hypothetical protein